MKKRLKRLVPLAGAFIVFITFIVKETRKDRLKELADSIDSAENAYMMRMDHRRMDAQVTAFKNEFEEFQKHPTVAKEDEANGGGDDAWPMVYTINNVDMINDSPVSAIADNERSDEELLENVTRVSEKLRDAGDIQKQLAEIRNTIEQFHKTLDGGPGEISGGDLSTAPNDRATWEWKLERGISVEIYDLSSNIIKSAEAERERDEQQREKWTWVVYALYTAGWSLGVFGLWKRTEESKEIEAIAEEI
jgi:hypothetical protein